MLRAAAGHRELIALLQRALDKTKSASDEAEVIGALLEVMQSPALASLEGTVAFGYELDDDERSQVAGLGERLADDFVIVRHGEAPSLVFSLVMIGVGFAGVGLLVLMIGIMGRK